MQPIDVNLAPAVRELRRVYDDTKGSSLWTKIIAPRDEVFREFKPIFERERLPQLTEEEFRRFLSFKNNRHWTNIHRHVGRITSDMTALRKALLVLTDEGGPSGQPRGLREWRYTRNGQGDDQPNPAPGVSR